MPDCVRCEDFGWLYENRAPLGQPSDLHRIYCNCPKGKELRKKHANTRNGRH